jgi:hypothetical protein
MATTSALVEGSAPSAVAERSPLDMPVGSAAQSGGVPGSQLRGPGGSHDHPARGQRRRRAGIVGGHRAGVSQVRSALLTIRSSELVNQPGVALCHAAALVVLRRARRSSTSVRVAPLRVLISSRTFAIAIVVVLELGCDRRIARVVVVAVHRQVLERDLRRLYLRRSELHERLCEQPLMDSVARLPAR